MLNNKYILITGGSGSLGHALVERICSEYKLAKVIIFSRDEYKQSLMQKQYDYECLRYFIGDVRDLQRLKQVCRNIDVVIHAAALKQIPTLEYNPTEAVRTNVDGTRNVIEACTENSVQKAVLISTDKAVNPINLYGATKLCAEKMFLAANNFNKTQFSVVRYGNVLNSRGSVVEKFLKLKEQGIREFPITDMRMTRFWITLADAADLVLDAINGNGEMLIPKLPSMRISEVARAIEPDCAFKEIGIRPGEKLHEALDEGYTSDKNDLWLSVEALRRKIGI